MCLKWQHDPEAHEAHGFALALRTMRPARIEPVRTGPLVVDLDAGRVTVHGRQIALTEREWAFLSYLAAGAGQLREYDDIIREVWGDEFLTGDSYRASPGRSGGWWASRHLIRTNVARLRAKLGEAGPLIVTVKGVGLRLERVKVTP